MTHCFELSSWTSLTCPTVPLYRLHQSHSQSRTVKVCHSPHGHLICKVTQGQRLFFQAMTHIQNVPTEEKLVAVLGFQALSDVACRQVSHHETRKHCQQHFGLDLHNVFRQSIHTSTNLAGQTKGVTCVGETLLQQKRKRVIWNSAEDKNQRWWCWSGWWHDEHFICDCARPPIWHPQWGAADAEIKVPSGENTELKRSPFQAWSTSVYSHTCYTYCQGFLPCLFLHFRSIHLHFFQNLSQKFSCVGCS